MSVFEYTYWLFKNALKKPQSIGVEYTRSCIVVSSINLLLPYLRSMVDSICGLFSIRIFVFVHFFPDGV